MTLNGVSRREQAERERGELVVAWVITVVACLYCGWMGFHLWRAAGPFAAMYEGLGAQLPEATRILVVHGGWIYPACFGGLMAALVAKELLVRDKRLSAMLTVLVTVVAQFLAHWMTTVFYLPLFELIGKLS